VLAVIAYYGNASTYVGMALLGAVASTHVIATGYLLTDADVRSFMTAHPAKMIAVPAALAAVFGVALSMPGTMFFVLIVLAVFLYQTWHFGAQNIGVSSFVSFCERGRPLDILEKRAIRAGIVCGMFGILYAMPPTFGYTAEQMPVPQWLREILMWAHVLGKIAAALIAGLALLLAGRSLRKGGPMTALVLFTSICFFFPMYLSNDFLFAIGMFSTAHGLQYIVFLGAHSASGSSFNKGMKLGFLVAPMVLAGIMLLAHLFRPSLIAVSHENLPLLGSILMGSLTLTHFWVDQHLWRMKERGAWLKKRYAFIFAKD